jgi:hypothetical protein
MHGTVKVYGEVVRELINSLQDDGLAIQRPANPGCAPHNRPVKTNDTLLLTTRRCRRSLALHLCERGVWAVTAREHVALVVTQSRPIG